MFFYHVFFYQTTNDNVNVRAYNEAKQKQTRAQVRPRFRRRTCRALENVTR